MTKNPKIVEAGLLVRFLKLKEEVLAGTSAGTSADPTSNPGTTGTETSKDATEIFNKDDGSNKKPKKSQGR